MIRKLRTYILCFTLLLHSAICLAEITITGKVASQQSEAIIGAIVKATTSSHKTIAFTSTDENGLYKISITHDSIPRHIIVACLGYETKTISLNSDKQKQIINVTLSDKPFELKEVVVKIPPIHNVGDTIVYQVGAFASKADRTIEDVLKRLPGIEVKPGGQIHYNGEQINKFYIEGLDLLGSRYTIATRNISPDDIESVNVYENHQPKKALKNLKISKQAGINLKLKKDKKIKPIGHLKGGIGYGDDVNWLAEAFALIARKNRQSITSAKGNSIGQSYGSETGSFRNVGSYGFVPTNIFSTAPFGTASIPSSRYFYNKSAYASYNTIYKLTPDVTINATADYAYESRRYSNSSITSYWDASPIVIEEHNKTKLSSHGAKLNIKFEKNTAKNYLSDALRVSGSFSDNLHQLSRTKDIAQSHRTNNVSISNNFSTIINSGKKAYEISSNTSFSNTPLNYIHAVTTEGTGKDVIVNQYAEGIAFRTTEKTGFSHNLSQTMFVGAYVTFDATYNTFSSDNDKHQINDLSGYKISTSVAPYMQITGRKASWRTEIPVMQQDVKFGNFSMHKPVVGFTSSVNYNLSRRVKTSFDIGRSYTTGNISDFIESPIYTTYRQTTVLGTGQLSMQHSDRISANLNYRNTIQGRFASLSLSYSRNTYNQLSSSNVSSDATSDAKEISKNHGNSFGANASYSKFFKDIHTTVKILSSATIISRDVRKQGILTTINSGVYTANGIIESDIIRNVLTMQASAVYTHSRQNTALLSSPISTNDVGLTLHISYFPISMLELYASSNHEWQSIKDGARNSYTFVDAGTRLSHKRMEWEITVKNITDQRWYEHTAIRSINTYTQRFALRPLEVVLSMKYKF